MQRATTALAPTDNTPSVPGGLAEAFEATSVAGNGAALGRAGGATAAAPASGAGRSLDPALVAHVHDALGIDARAVQIHEGPEPARIDARAYAQGEHVWFQPGGFAPDTEDGLALLGHELTHVQQQRDGRVVAPQGKDAPINADAAFEAEADAGGARLAAHTPKASVASLRATAGAAPAEGPIQRVVVSVPAVRRTGDEMLAMNVRDFDRYARSQLDWHTNPNVSEAQGGRLRAVLELADREPGLIAACRDMTVVNVAAAIADDTRARRLLSYTGAVTRARRTVRIESTANVDTAVSWGEALETLEAGLPGALLEQIVRHRQFVRLIADNGIAPLIAYATSDPRPTLHCDTGQEVDSILDFLMTAQLSTYQGRVPHVRNIHRFRGSALRIVRDNWAARAVPRGQRLTVLAHSTFDDKGAFHRDDDLDDVIRQRDNFVLLIEGKASLADVQATITQIRTDFGPIAQVMFAGHGGARDMEMGGALEERGGRQVPGDDEAIDLDHNGDKTRALLDATIRAMAVDGRIVFNACLTDSNHVDPERIGADDGRGDLQNELRANKSLAQYTRDRAGELRARVTAVGANGSFSGGALMDDEGRLDIISGSDRALTSDKATYARQGTDPTGAMRALLEVWAGNPATAGQIAHTRAAVGDTSWKGSVIEALFDLVDRRYPDDPQAIAYLAEAAGPLKKVRHEDEANAARVRSSVTQDEWDVIGPRVARSADFRDHVPLVVHQVTSLFGVGGDGAFLQAANGFTCATASRDDLIKLDALADRGALARLLTPGAGTTRGRLVLAVLALLNDGTRNVGRDFLRPLGNAGGFGGVDVNGALGGLRSERELLQRLGLTAADPVNNDINANLDEDRDGTNETHANPRFARGRVRSNTEYLRDRPTGAPPEDDDMDLGLDLRANTVIQIVGEHTDGAGTPWYLFARPDGVAYVRVAAVEIVR